MQLKYVVKTRACQRLKDIKNMCIHEEGEEQNEVEE